MARIPLRETVFKQYLQLNLQTTLVLNCGCTDGLCDIFISVFSGYNGLKEGESNKLITSFLVDKK